ncbi:Carbohydrate binding domain [Streptococcus acidominimus]|nr:Carbohydrate binding domain [Streptococcus acidominimus]
MISVFLLVYLIFQSSIALAFWQSGTFDTANASSLTIASGKYYYGSIQIYDPNSSYKAGQLIVKNDVLYMTNMDIDVSDWYHDPEAPNKDWSRYMRYRLASSEYSSVNRYVKGDYATYKGATYEATGLQNPNTFTEGSPEYPNKWIKVSSIELNTWYPYKVYYEGDIIDYQGKRYRCLVDECYHINPSYSNYWVII